MINFSADFLNDQPEVRENQEEQILVNRFVLPAFATDEHRTQMFRHLMEVLDDVTFTERRILIESGDVLCIKMLCNSSVSQTTFMKCFD